MRVSKENAAKNRDAILDAASRLFREKGIDGTGVAEIAKEAGLTHGALYAHFPSKDALAAEAFSHGFAGNMALIREWAGDRALSFEEFLESMFSPQQRDNLVTGCPMTASASEIARQGETVAASFASAFKEMVALLEKSQNHEVPPSQKRHFAVSALAGQIGAIAVARAVARVNPSLSNEVLRSVCKTVSTEFMAKSKGTPKADRPAKARRTRS
jgi:TetR/AcrR family transcriptional repressor of nem operon